ncbi:hypothetical protein C2845_PM07G18980 [Panicum miliaceum]|uniref:Uncharacterized protein n=1 Tax=Panicum miliaceum TaxID=4540 RepID=A0A3L6SLH4_PANMI|nr:hypothetical protein C2845_PM07G18980 [Panicum miliaceum]
MAEAPQYQILVRLLDGRTRCLRFTTPTVSGAALLDVVASLSRVPAAALRLVTGRLDVSPSSVLTSAADGQFPSASALLRLRGGKGGFGSLLRGAASKAGQNKTSNFDACRDINGRRLRHVNAERRLEEWKAEAADRQLEKLAEDFIKKKAKEAGRRGGSSAAEVDKYLEKYRKDAEICVNAVEESVRASLGKRKTAPKPPPGADSKKLKIWLGKNKVEDDESDSDSDVDDEDREDEGTDAKSIVLDDGNCSNGSSKSEDEKPDLGSVSGSHSEGESSGVKSRHIDSEENGKCLKSTVEPTMRSGAEGGDFESDGSVETDVGMVDQPISVNSAAVVASEETLKSDGVKADVDDTASAASNQNNPEVPQVEESADVSNSHSEPLDLAKYSSAAELETLGLEKLKVELQSRGLKCGGTLQERAARLFLLKTTPLDKLPKKLLAKPTAGGK